MWVWGWNTWRSCAQKQHFIFSQPCSSNKVLWLCLAESQYYSKRQNKKYRWAERRKQGDSPSSSHLEIPIVNPLVHCFQNPLISNMRLWGRGPQLFGTRDWFHRRQFFRGPGWGGIVSGWFKCITFKLTSSYVAQFLIGPDPYWSQPKVRGPCSRAGQLSIYPTTLSRACLFFFSPRQLKK